MTKCLESYSKNNYAIGEIILVNTSITETTGEDIALAEHYPAYIDYDEDYFQNLGHVSLKFCDHKNICSFS